MPIGVLRTRQKYTNFEMVIEWRHLKPAGNSGVFVWVPEQALAQLKSGVLPDYGIEVQMLDHGFRDQYEKSGSKGDWFTTHGDIFAVGKSKLTPFPPLSPNGSRSFPRKALSRGAGEWNHYYVRGINGELRLWVNGEEVSGGSGADPRTGYLCLEAEGSPIEFRNIRVRECLVTSTASHYCLRHSCKTRFHTVHFPADSGGGTAMMKRYVFAALCRRRYRQVSTEPVAAQVTTGTIVGTVTDPGGVVPGATVTITRGQPRHVGYVRHRRDRHLHGAVPHSRHLPVEVNVSGFKKWVRDGVILQVNQRARVDVTLEVGRHRRNHDGRRLSAAAPDRFVRGRHRHRGAGDQGTAAERPELRDAGLPDARRHAGPGGREPLGREHVQSARRLELQRARPSGQRQRLADRRHRQQRVHLQHRDHRAVGRAGARVQGAVRRVLRGVRPRRRRRLGRDQVGQQRRCTARRSSTCATTRSTRGTSSCARSPLPDGGLQVDPKPPLNRHQFGGAAGGALVVPGSTTGTTGRSSSPTTPA